LKERTEMEEQLYDAFVRVKNQDGTYSHAVITGLDRAEMLMRGFKLPPPRKAVDPLDGITDPFQRADILRMEAQLEAWRKNGAPPSPAMLKRLTVKPITVPPGRPENVREYAAAEHQRARERVRAAKVGKRDLACSTIRDHVRAGTMPDEDSDACAGGAS
jgi:hypothetical protein